MYFQQRFLEQNRTFNGMTGLDTIDLPNEGFLSGIALKVWGTNGADTDEPDVWLHDRLERIEVVVNGSQVVKSYSGEQLLALMHYKKTPIMSHDCKNMPSGSAEEFFYINFGRHYHDDEYCLDLSKVKDPELRLTYNFNMTGHHGWTKGEAMASEPYRTVIPHMLRNSAPAPKGYVKTSELYRATTAASLHENMMVARGPIYSNLYFQSFYTMLGIGMTVDYLELNFNMSDIIPMRLQPHGLADDNLRQYGYCDSFMQQFTMTGGQAYPHPIDQGVVWGTFPAAIDGVVASGDLWANTMPTVYIVASTGARGAASVNCKLTYKGIWPFSMVAIPTLDPWDERTWIHSKDFGDVMVRAELLAGAGVANTIKLLGDEVVTSYPA